MGLESFVQNCEYGNVLTLIRVKGVRKFLLPPPPKPFFALTAADIWTKEEILDYLQQIPYCNITRTPLILEEAKKHSITPQDPFWPQLIEILQQDMEKVVPLDFRRDVELRLALPKKDCVENNIIQSVAWYYPPPLLKRDTDPTFEDDGFIAIKGLFK